MLNNNTRLRVKLLNIVLNYVVSRGWTNYDNFAQEFVDNIVTSLKAGNLDLQQALSKSPGTFFRLNSLSRQFFLSPEVSVRIKATVADQLPEPGNVEPVQAASLLEKMSTMRLSRYGIVGDYARYDGHARNVLKDLKQRILAAFHKSTKAHENYLIWGPPGSGKTFFVKQLAMLLKTTVRFHDLNLASMNEAQFRSSLSEVDETPGAALCFLDEIDSRPNESWPYPALLGSLDARSVKGEPRVFVMAGSSGLSLADLKVKMGGYVKGKDLLSRIPHGNEFQIPGFTAGDKILLTLAGLRQAGKDVGKEITEVEKVAIYYVVLQPVLNTPRQLREFVVRCIERVPIGEDRVKYDNMFDAGEESSKKFWMEVKSSAPRLVNSFVLVEE